MLVVYRKNEKNWNIAQFVEYITYLVTAKNVDLLHGDFDEDSISGGSSKM